MLAQIEQFRRDYHRNLLVNVLIHRRSAGHEQLVKTRRPEEVLYD